MAGRSSFALAENTSVSASRPPTDIRMNYRARLFGVLVSLTPLLASCDGEGGVDFDRARPTVMSTTPVAGATGIERNTAIAVSFSEPVAASSVTTSTLTVTSAAGDPVAGTVAVSGSTATFIAAAPLASGTTYTARVTTDVTDLAGNGLARAHAWTFTTAVNPPPTVVGTAPVAGASDVALNTAIVATFSEPVALASVTATTFQVSPAQGASITGARTVNGATITFTPAEPLLPDTTYNVLLTTGITDVDGAPLANAYTWFFRTLAPAAP
jgi:hypothetical protein